MVDLQENFCFVYNLNFLIEKNNLSKIRKSEHQRNKRTINDIYSSDTEDENIASKTQRKCRRFISDSSDGEEECSKIYYDGLSDVWIELTSKDEENTTIPFSIGQERIGPQNCDNCIDPLDYFQLYFTNELIENIVVKTNNYARSKIAKRVLSERSIWNTWKDLTVSEMKAFLGLILNMGIVRLSNIQDYWSKEEEFQVPFFSKIIDKGRFMQIFWMLHLNEVHEPNAILETRLQKVSKYLEYLDLKFREHFIPNKCISIVESVVKYKGRLGSTVYNPQKPTKWGIRLYVLTDSESGYLYSFLPYYGSITTENLPYPELPVTNRAVLYLYKNLQNSISEASGYHIYTGRFYSSVLLAKELLSQSCHFTGIIMTNGKYAPNCLKEGKLKKGDIVACRNENVLLFQLRDKKIVSMISTWHTVEIETKNKIPHIIQDYNKNMNGVNLANDCASVYCFMKKTLKWWRRLFFWGLEMSVINSYILYNYRERESNSMTYLKFVKVLVRELTKDFYSISTNIPRVFLNNNQRLNNELHVIQLNPLHKHKDCKVCSNRKIKGGRRETNYYCETCTDHPALHVGECFKRYHTLQDYKI
ncbi:piggyBac transposable element-derived protein 4-like isoform X2 [Vespa crabro]|uniref:piggyBac transposable element-derived protein 4-like isoform X2 n=1 Tax=Vespa crabro TaxID=7445 RepID=UPI001F01254B|nr:piggyBac transposable element-derived protein 4-like isoform X2 [Vespa crabro]